MDLWPLVGRDPQCRDIDRAVADRDVGGVVLVGDSGSGLTRLTRDTLHRLAARGRRTGWVLASVASAGVAFEAVAHLLPDDSPTDGDTLTVIRGAARNLAADGGRGSFVLAVDDLHLLDPASAALVAHLVVRRLAFVVMTLRRGRPAAGNLAALWKEELIVRVEVPPLSLEETDALIDYALGGAVDGITRRRLHATAGGRPGVLRDLLISGHELSALRRRYGVWRWYGPMTGSSRVAETIASSLAACPPDARTVAEIVACGDPMPLRLLEALVGGAGIAAAERLGLITIDRDGASRMTVRLAMPLHGRAVRGQMAVAEAQAIHARLIDAALAAPLRRREDPARLAAWQRGAGSVSAPRFLLPAARYLINRDPDLAEWSVRAALAAGGQDAEANLLLARILRDRGGATEAATVLEGCGPDPRGLVAVARAATLYFGLGQPDRALEELDRPEAARDLSEALRAGILLFEGACEPALETAHTILNGPSTSEEAIAWAAAAGVGAAGLAGRLEDAMRLRRLGLVASRALVEDPPWARTRVEYGACAALFLGGEIGRATALADEEYAATAAVGSPRMLAGWALLRGVLAAAAGRVVTAQALLREAAALLEETGPGMIGLCLFELAAAAALAGDSRRASTWLARASEHDGERSGAGRALAPWRDRARAWVVASTGAERDAVPMLLRASADAAQNGQYAVEARLCYDAARLGAADRVRDRLAVLSSLLPVRFGCALVDASAGLAEPDSEVAAAGMVRAARAFAKLGATVLAAEALRAASRSYRRNGQRPRAQVYGEEANALLRGCEGVRTPLLALARADARLTGREREVVLLAVTHSSRDIGEKLGLALSTVNNHLARAYAKLGVAGRGELAALLGPDGQ